MNQLKMRHSLNRKHTESPLSDRIEASHAQLAGMKAKLRRLEQAIQQREQHLNRLEASKILSDSTPPVAPDNA